MLLLMFFIGIVTSQPDCTKFLSYYEDAKALESLTRGHNMIVEFGGMQPVLSVGYSNSTLTAEQEADAFTVVAGMTIRDGGSLASFQDNAVCLNRVETAVASRPKYQSMDGYGNNLAHPFWGNAETPFGRFGPKNYADGIHSLRKSDRTSLDLPSPREIVDKVLNKVKITQRTSKKLNSLFLQLIVALAHDVGHFSPVDPLNKAQRIGCCLPGNKAEIPGHSRHSACIPIEVPKDDEFYKKSETTCIGLVRSQMVSTPSGVQFGEIKNKASSFADLSVVYGANIDESNKVRSFSQGKLLLTPGQTLPVDSAGQFTAIAGRLNIVITANSWSVFFIRNHNNIAERLAVLNPAWNDEKVFQEARKINIAIYQNIATSKTVTENIFGSFVNEGYKEDVDPSETVEFHSTVTRCTHFLIPSTLRLLESNGQFTDTLQSDLIGRVDILDGQTESYIRGAMNQSIFDEYYSDELRNKLFKGPNGAGIDLFAIDIQRGREQGHPTWLQARQQCGLPSTFNDFRDLESVLEKPVIDLLRNSYESVKDIDLYVGGALETFQSLNQKLLGPTFSCIYRDQYRRMTSGDAYFFSHVGNPNPFTNAKLDSVCNFSMNHLICNTVDIGSVNDQWHLTDLETTKIPCSTFKPLDLNPWKES